ncbi:MAG: hypothetical protein H8E44_27620 [Planctomycetes bacterium]|nr:hypothetical protein [Planctomycetota bacterium]MBL7040826.1 hypothetical protein [Pirellulaceae bacterium]
MKIFLAGIMQGSHRDDQVLHDQGYRGRLTQLLSENLPNADVYDPLANHSDSINYDDETGRDVFFRHNRMCGQVDLVVAFAPEASMGTAIEMWEAYRNGRAVIAISPLAHNWTVKFCSHEIYPNLESFEAALVSGQLRERVTEVLAR